MELGAVVCMIHCREFVVAKNWKQPECPSIGDWLINYAMFVQ